MEINQEHKTTALSAFFFFFPKCRDMNISDSSLSSSADSFENSVLSSLLPGDDTNAVTPVPVAVYCLQKVKTNEHTHFKTRV